MKRMILASASPRRRELMEMLGVSNLEIVPARGEEQPHPELTPPELAADLVDNGIYLAGGGSLLRNIDKLIQKETGLPVYLAENPLYCVALGAGKALEELNLLKRVSIKF